MQASATAEAVAASQTDHKTHLLLAASGSVATIKLPLIIQALARHPRLSIRIITTRAAAHFLGGQAAEQPALASLRQLPNVDGLYEDAAEWGPEPWRRGAAILHIELRRWAHLLVIAPLSANSLAKIVGGLADDLLSCVVRAWDTSGEVDGVCKKIVVAPAMNTAMWQHPVTARQIRVLEEDWSWFEVLLPQEKTLMCADVGNGAMREWSEIVTVIEARLGLGAPDAAARGS